MLILGIDPGSSITGYGLIVGQKGKTRPVDFGTIRIPKSREFPEKLHQIHLEVSELIQKHNPDLVAVETAFYQKNARSALVLGHVRGVVLLSAQQAGRSILELTPREVKQSVTGNGGASKEQVQFMVTGMLGITRNSLPLDASDALAVAICSWQRQALQTTR